MVAIGDLEETIKHDFKPVTGVFTLNPKAKDQKYPILKLTQKEIELYDSWYFQDKTKTFHEFYDIQESYQLEPNPFGINNNTVGHLRFLISG